MLPLLGKYLRNLLNSKLKLLLINNLKQAFAITMFKKKTLVFYCL